MALSYTSVEAVIRLNPAVGSLTSVTSSSLFAFAVDAEAVINSTLAKVFTVPVAGSPPLLAAVAADLTLYRLFTRRLLTGESANTSPWADRYKESLETLEKLVTGDMTLVDSAGSVISASTGIDVAQSNNMNYKPTMNELDPEFQYVDSDKEDDLAD